MSDQELLNGVKDYIERYMFEGSKYHFSTQDLWVKQLYNIIKKQQKEIEELDESLHVARIGRRDLVAYVKQLKKENELLSEHCAKLEKPIIDKVLKRSKKGEPLEPDFD